MLERLKASLPFRVFQKYSADEGGNLAILVAWTGLLSMFPLVLALHALIGLVVRDPQVWASVQETVISTFPSDASGDVQRVLATATEGAAGRGIVGIVGLLLSGSALFGAMARAFNHIYRVQDRGLIGQRVMAVSMIVVFSVLVVVSLVASAAANVVLAAVQGAMPFPIPGAGVMLTVAAWGLSLLTAFVLFLVLYRVVPNARQTWREVWPGAVLAGIGFFLLGQLFPLYVRFFGGSFREYAVFGLFFLLMTWFWFLAQVLVLGAELNAYLSRPELRTVPETAPADAAKHRANASATADPHPGPVKRFLYAALTALVSWAVLLATRAALRLART